MKEKITALKNKAESAWKDSSKRKKGVAIGSAAIAILLITTIVWLVSRSTYAPLYNDLSVEESGNIKEELDDRDVSYKIKDNGTTIEVPEEKVDGLLVDLAGEGIPNSGDIDYSFFSENASWGVTDDEFDVMKLDAMQTELANLIQNIEGINNAEVMINMPEDPLFVNDAEEEESSASVMIDTEPGEAFEEKQIDSLYHLVSKAVPNLPEDNIVIRNQDLEYYDKNAGDYGENNAFTEQQTVKHEVEQDIQRRLQEMLGTMVGMDQVMVSVTADIDYTQENRTEELVDPVDVENVEGLPVSIEKIYETYSGNAPAGGTPGTDDEDVPGYEGEADGDDGDYELDKEIINNEFNRIQKDIIESPYKIRDLGIQIAVDNVKEHDGDDVTYLSAEDESEVESGISSMVDSIISTSIDEEYDDDIDPDEKASIVFQEFNEREDPPSTTTSAIPAWVYILGAILFAIIILLLVILMRSGKKDRYIEEDVPIESETEIPDVPDHEEESEEVKRLKQLESMARDKPEDFAKLLRSWISEE